MLNFNKQMLAAGVFFGGILFSNTKKTAHWSSRLSFGGDQLQRCTPGTWRAILQIGSGTGGAVPVNVKRRKQGHMPSKNMTAVRRKNGKGWNLWKFCAFFGVKLWWWEESIYLPFQLEILVLLKTVKRWWGWGVVAAGGGTATWDWWTKETTATGGEGVACYLVSFWDQDLLVKLVHCQTRIVTIVEVLSSNF